MLESLRITNFRMFDDFVIPRLGRVNLIVGKNNAGKSTVLEALRIYAKQAQPDLLAEIINSHDEQYLASESNNGSDDFRPEIALQHFFPGREFPTQDGLGIYIGNVAGDSFVKLDHSLYVDNFDEITDESGEVIRRRRRQSISKNDLVGADFAEQAVQVNVSGSARTGWIELNPQSSIYARRTQLLWEEVKDVPCSFVPTQFIELDVLASLWDRIALTDNDHVITEALQIIEPDVRGLVFVHRDPTSRARRRPGERNGQRTAIVKLENHSKPIPLNSMGDGMLRILQLILALFPARGGFLLIDEFENGLHFSVQEKTWKLIFDLAEKLDIQVFATTHSWDCIEAFKNAAVTSPASGILFRVGKSIRRSEQGRVVPTIFEEQELVNLTQADVEVR